MQHRPASVKCMRALAQIPILAKGQRWQKKMRNEQFLTFIGSHHLSGDKLFECVIAFHIQSQRFHETLFCLASAVQFKHQDSSEVTHRCLNLVFNTKSNVKPIFDLFSITFMPPSMLGAEAPLLAERGALSRLNTGIETMRTDQCLGKGSIHPASQSLRPSCLV